MEKVKEPILLFRYQTYNFPKLTPLYKTLKVARFTMTNRVILNHTNMKLFIVNKQKKQQTQYRDIQYNDQRACVLRRKDVKKRR